MSISLMDTSSCALADSHFLSAGTHISMYHHTHSMKPSSVHSMITTDSHSNRERPGRRSRLVLQMQALKPLIGCGGCRCACMAHLEVREVSRQQVVRKHVVQLGSRLDTSRASACTAGHARALRRMSQMMQHTTLTHTSYTYAASSQCNHEGEQRGRCCRSQTCSARRAPTCAWSRVSNVWHVLTARHSVGCMRSPR